MESNGTPGAVLVSMECYQELLVTGYVPTGSETRKQLNVKGKGAMEGVLLCTRFVCKHNSADSNGKRGAVALTAPASGGGQLSTSVSNDAAGPTSMDK